MTYASVLLVLLIAQVVVAILIFVNQDDFKTNILKVVEKLFQNNPTVAPNRQTIDAIQQAVSCWSRVYFFSICINSIFGWKFQTECCGFNGIGDWAGQIPPSCCKGNPSTCLASNAFQSNCRDSVRDFIIQYSNLLSWIAIGVAGIEVKYSKIFNSDAIVQWLKSLSIFSLIAARGPDFRLLSGK